MIDELAGRGLIDTSVLIAQETGRPVRDLPEIPVVSAATLAELHIGVLIASDAASRARRLHTLSSIGATFEMLMLDQVVAWKFAEITAEARQRGRRPGIMDTWIAATALANDLPLYTRDDDFNVFTGLRVVMV